jgi:hypothetical protein
MKAFTYHSTQFFLTKEFFFIYLSFQLNVQDLKQNAYFEIG